MINSKNYITVQGWMVSELKLNCNELLCYALIYGFCQDGNSVFSGTANYIADWLNIDRRQVMRILQKLTEKGLIEKIDKTVNGVKLVDYKIVKHESGSDVIGCDKMSYPCDKMSHHIDIDNKEKKNNIIINNNITKRKEKDFYAEVLVEMLEIHLGDAYNRKFTTNDWYKQMELLIKHDGIEFERARDVMNWHFEHLDRAYCHVILSARAFREKFLALETQMKKQTAYSIGG
ncbi:MAG: helix-turn-helix domain-containing protein [Alphaproteobacteria bacterium]|nr:helix-turn-helix domain-containing protein [Alphaproteobacteria bacterium]